MVDGLSLDIEEKTFFALVGESGCGKTTTLKMINRLIEPTRGDIWVDNKKTSDHDAIELRRQVGYVFQGIGLFPHMTVEENIGVVPKLLGWDKGKIDARIDFLLDVVGLGSKEFLAKYPRQMSGGQRQRIGFARALAGKPSVLLMDEPFGALDPVTRESLQNEVLEIHKRLELTTVMVTHDMAEALLLADKIAVMHEGKILQVGTPPELLRSPKTPYIEQLLSTPKAQAKKITAMMNEAGQS